jgi:hypothetical protein
MNNPMNPNNPLGPRQGPAIVKIWTCSKCGAEVGRGDFPPATCPHCGARLLNGVGGGGRGPSGPPNNNFTPNGPQANTPPMNQPPNTQPNPQPPVNNPVNIPNEQPPVGGFDRPRTTTTTASTTSSGTDGEDSNSWIWIMVGIAGGALLLAVGAVVVFTIMRQVGDGAELAQDRRRRRRRLEY